MSKKQTWTERKPAWTEREALVDAMDVKFSRTQISNLRKVLSGGEQKSTTAKTAATADSSRAKTKGSGRAGVRAAGA
ncbi:MAG: hypothetical protein ACHQHO_11955 [Solirubrobacterales bacterium]